MNNQKNAQDNIKKIMEALGKDDITAVFSANYSGPGCGSIFGTEADVIHLRLGRKHAEGNEDYKFSHGGSDPFARLCSGSDYTIFLPLTAENIENVKEGNDFKYAVANYFKEDKEGWVTQIDPEQVVLKKGNLNNLKAEMPKRRIPEVSSIDVKVGNAVTSGVTCSNADDNGDIEIRSLTGHSSLLYTPAADQPFRPAFQWGSFGWKKPVEVSIKDNKLYFDDSRNGAGDAGVWQIQFRKEGYEAVKVK